MRLRPRMTIAVGILGIVVMFLAYFAVIYTIIKLIIS